MNVTGRTLKSLRNAALGGVAAAGVLASVVGAQAAVIPGPVLTDDDGGWTTAGIGFMALDNSHLTSFVFQNQGAADTVVLTDGAGNILDSLSTPAGTPSYTASVDWSLTSGDTYFLLQTSGPNALFASYGASLPSNSDIAITLSGTFAYSTGDAASNLEGWGSNEYWAGFNNITTSTSTIPEPSTWAMMLLGFAGLGYAAVRRAGKDRIATSAA
jgi:hypothetical protein